MKSTNKTFLLIELYNDSLRTKFLDKKKLFFKNEKMITCNVWISAHYTIETYVL